MLSTTSLVRSRAVVVAAVLLLSVAACDGPAARTEPARRPSTVPSHASTASVVPSAAGGTTPSQPASCSSVPVRPPVATGSGPRPVPAASSRPRWGPPELLSRDRSSLDDSFPAEVMVRGRATTAVWEAHEAVGSRVRVVKVADRRASGGWTRPYVVARRSGETYGLASALGPRGMVVVVWTEFVGGHDTVVERHRENGRWSPVRALGDNRGGGGWSVVVGPRGAITVAWENWRSESNINVVSRDDAGHWETPQQLAHGGASVSLVVNRRGDVGAVWSTGEGVGVAIRRHGVGCWRTTPRIRSPFLYADDPRLALDGRGRALVVWGRVLDDGSAPRYLAWSRMRSDGSWTPTRYLGRRRPNGVDYVGLSMNARGQAVAVWKGMYGAEAARFEFGHGWTRPSTLASGDYGPPYVAADGTAIAVLWSRWLFQHPGGPWRSGGVFPEAVGDFPRTHADGRRLTVAFYRDRLTVRLMTLPRT